MDNDDAIAKHTHGITPLYAYEKCLCLSTSNRGMF